MLQNKKMKSIFRLEAVRCYDSDEHQYRDASTSILGHYSSLDKALGMIPKYKADTYDAEDIFAFMVKEIAVDAEAEYIRWLSVRSYDADGNLYAECLQDYNLVNQYKGRDASTIRFHVGDIVEALEQDKLYFAIVAALPPTPEDHYPLLDAEDDCYLLLPMGLERDSHLHVPPTHVFPLSRALDAEIVKQLKTRLSTAKIISMKSETQG